MFDFEKFYKCMTRCGLGKWNEKFEIIIENAVNKPDGNLSNWMQTLSELPDIETEEGIFIRDNTWVMAKAKKEASSQQKSELKTALMKLSPWRKGPFDLCGVEIDAEWRADIKWNYLVEGISDLKDKVVLDLGCSNGYYMFRIAEKNPAMVLGIDTSRICWMQFEALQKYLKYPNLFYLPIGFEDMPEECGIFDTVFAMGILYHRKAPFEFLRTLKYMLKPGGELILETITVEGDERTVLVPEDRYAGMKNVWFFPSDKALVVWLKKAGFRNINIVDKYMSTIEEQRQTEWMTNESLKNWLDPNDFSKTIEGLPAPIRTIVTCNR
jgi:tRNA (mo5U34)-methyltransferase